MPVNSPHPQYKDNIERWSRCRDAYEGEDAVKQKGRSYLPKPHGMERDEYEAYKVRALYYEAVGRTVDGFVGAIARKDPKVTAPSGMTPLLRDATLNGISFNELLKLICAESILQGRGGLLVDYSEEDDRPYLAWYCAEDIVNWNFASSKVGWIVLRETVYEPDAKDQFTVNAVEQYRELSLDESGYTVTIWRKPEKSLAGNDWEIYRTVSPTRRGAVLDELPFYFVAPLGKTSRIERPPMLGLVNVSLSHYRSSADLEHGRHFTGLPTLYITGYRPGADERPIAVGSAAALLLDDPAAKVGFAEFTGQGLQSLETALETKEAQMAALGASMLAPEKKGVEAAETTRLRVVGENSLLLGVVTAVENASQAALVCAAKWIGLSDTIDVQMNRDFAEITLDPKTLLGLVAAFQAGAITLEAFLFTLQQADMLPPETDIVAEAAKLSAAADKAAAEQHDKAVALRTAVPAATED